MSDHAKAATPLTIDKAQVKAWSACQDGYKWFLENFPQGGDYCAIQKALRKDKRFDDVRWLTNQVWQTMILKSPSITSEVTADHDAESKEIIDLTNALVVDAPDSVDTSDNGKYAAQIGSSGDDAQIGSSGYAVQIGSSGYDVRIGSSGNDARIGSSGYAVQIGSSGNAVQIGSSGNDARIGSSGNAAQINAKGADSVIACAGLSARIKSGTNGAVAVAWHDGTRARFAVGYVGENIKENTWYAVNGSGEFVEVEA